MEDSMNKINSLLITASLLTLSHAGFAAQTDNNRYEEIVAAYSPETNRFKLDFIPKTGDIAVVADHKTKLEKERNSYKKSWMPAILKTIGAGFGIDAGISAIYTTLGLFPYESMEPIYAALSYPHQAASLAIYPVQKVRSKLTKPIIRPLSKELNQMADKNMISNTTWRMGQASLMTGTSLFSAAIATYLFKKANSYQTEIERLEKEIDLDINMLKLLLGQLAIIKSK